MHFRYDEPTALQSRVDRVDVLVSRVITKCCMPFTDHLQCLVHCTRHLGLLLRREGGLDDDSLSTIHEEHTLVIIDLILVSSSHVRKSLWSELGVFLTIESTTMSRFTATVSVDVFRSFLSSSTLAFLELRARRCNVGYNVNYINSSVIDNEYPSESCACDTIQMLKSRTPADQTMQLNSKPFT